MWHTININSQRAYIPNSLSTKSLHKKHAPLTLIFPTYSAWNSQPLNIYMTWNHGPSLFFKLNTLSAVHHSFPIVMSEGACTRAVIVMSEGACTKVSWEYKLYCHGISLLINLFKCAKISSCQRNQSSVGQSI